MKDNRIRLIALGILLLLVGVFFTFKPMVENKIDEKKQNEILSLIEAGHSEILVNIRSNDDVDYYDLDDEEEAEISDETEVINSVNGIGIIEIESIDLKLPVVEGATKATLKVALGHVSESATIGDVGNCIIAGHRRYDYGLMFNRLDEVEVGDVIKYTDVDGKALNFKVYATTVIVPNDTSLFDYDDGQKKLTLLTCTPIKKATHRLLIQSSLIE